MKYKMLIADKRLILEYKWCFGKLYGTKVFDTKKNYSKVPEMSVNAITKYNIAIFCDSEFFLGKDRDQLKPRLLKGDNGGFGVNKISNKRAHDEEVNKELMRFGWTVIHFWRK